MFIYRKFWILRHLDILTSRVKIWQVSDFKNLAICGLQKIF